MTANPQPAQDREDASYDIIKAELEAFGAVLTDMLSRLLASEGITVHSTTYRVKTKNSASAKVRMGGERYSSIMDLRDMLGVRIITHFEDDVDRVAEIIKKEFEVDANHSVDKRALLDPDRFGYSSLHYVLSLDPSRSALREYRQFNARHFELQIRSILQHAWAEIEHDLGYKTKSGVPREIRRRFSRLAGLLELADVEFAAVRNALGAYEQRISETGGQELRGLEINQSTITAFADNDPLVRKIDNFIASAWGPWKLQQRSTAEAAADVERFKALGFNTIEDIYQPLESNMRQIAAFAIAWLQIPDDDADDVDEVDDVEDGMPDEGGNPLLEPESVAKTAEHERAISHGISLFYLWYFLLAASATEEKRIEQLERTWPDEGRKMSLRLMTALTHSQEYTDQINFD